MEGWGQPCRSQAGTATATGTSWRGGPAWAPLLAPRRGRTLPPSAHHSGCDPWAEAQNILPAEPVLQPQTGKKEHSTSSLKKQENVVFFPVPSQGFLILRAGIFSAWLCLLHKPWERLSYSQWEWTNKNGGLLQTDSSNFTFPGMLIACQWKMQPWTAWVWFIFLWNLAWISQTLLVLDNTSFISLPPIVGKKTSPDERPQNTAWKRLQPNFYWVKVETTKVLWVGSCWKY